MKNTGIRDAFASKGVLDARCASVLRQKMAIHRLPDEAQ
jgi:hypothetical protein